MRLIGAREVIHIHFDEYLEKIRKEFQIGTYDNCEVLMKENLQINFKSQKPIHLDLINQGIQIGIELNKTN
jgi:hypothetical protein